MDVAAGGEVSGERGWALPHFATAAGVGVVGIGKPVVLNYPEALEEEDGQQSRRDLLGAVEAEPAQMMRGVGRS